VTKDEKRIEQFILRLCAKDYDGGYEERVADVRKVVREFLTAPSVPASEGEVGEVIRVTPCAQMQMYEVIVAVEGVDWPEPGDRVRVVRVTPLREGE
jgi:hypothetical protein